MSITRASAVSLVVAAVAVAVVAMTAAACGVSKAPKEVLADAQDAMSRLQSYRFQGTLSDTDREGTTTATQSGEWASPDRYHLKIEAEGHVNELIVVSLRAYTFDSDYPERGWRKQPLVGVGVMPPSFEYLGQLTDLELVADDSSIGDVPVYHVRGKLPREEDRARKAEEQLDPDDPFRQEKLVSIARWETGYDLFIGKEDHLIRRVIHDLYMEGWEPSTDAEGVKTFRTIPISERIVTNYSDFNVPITIEAP